MKIPILFEMIAGVDTPFSSTEDTTAREAYSLEIEIRNEDDRMAQKEVGEEEEGEEDNHAMGTRINTSCRR